jgi:ABC-2 type transport system ATP-binding protein
MPGTSPCSCRIRSASCRGDVRRSVDGDVGRTVVPGTASGEHPRVMEIAVRVRGLVKRYPGASRRAVDGLALDVPAGRVVALLGPNGSGKTTTVEVLEGHRERDAGDVRVLGSDPARAGAGWRARIGIVLQGTADLADLTPHEIVTHVARYYPDPRDPDETLALVGLHRQRHVLARALSGGQRRRLDVALGIVGRPELLFLDEPTTGFDPRARREFWGLVRELAAEGTTILLTTHYLDEAEALADRVAVMVEGRMVAEGPPATLGGRARGVTTVRWRDGVERTAAPTAFVEELARRYGGEVPGLVVTRPTLEDAYLSLVGTAPVTAEVEQ